MEHYKSVGVRLTEISYEAMVSDPDATLGPAMQATGLGAVWGDGSAAHSFYNLTGPVTTSSAQQVLEPVYTRAVGKWRRYARFLTPMLDEENEHDSAAAPVAPAAVKRVVVPPPPRKKAGGEL